MYHFREVATSDPYKRSHVVFCPDGVHRQFLELRLFEDEVEAREELLGKKPCIFLALYAAFRSYVYVKPTSIECIVPNRYFIKYRKHDGQYNWVELELENYGPTIYENGHLF